MGRFSRPPTNDFAPTIADLAGAEIPPEHIVDGRSFAPLLNEDAAPEWARKRFLVTNYNVTDEFWMPPSFYGVRGERSLYVLWKDEYGSREFYPALHTPGGAAQLENRYPELDEATREHFARLAYWFLHCSGETCRTLEDF
ncbi:MAG: sulfatase/phosphatase domain-containing protein [Chloroflexota bacterium]